MPDNPPLWIDMRRLRELHAERLRACGIPSDPDGDYAGEVAARIFQWQRGLDTEPIAHPHQFKEVGMCLDCDAAAVIAAWREESNQRPSQSERVAAIIATMRYLAGSMPVDSDDGERRERDLSHQAWLIETADHIECTTPDDWWCCPVCEEAVCDSDCPLAPVRS